jgi:hypothetical protein
MLCPRLQLKSYARSFTTDLGGRSLHRHPAAAIFVVDDDEGFRSFVADALEGAGYRVEQVAPNAAIAGPQLGVAAAHCLVRNRGGSNNRRPNAQHVRGGDRHREQPRHPFSAIQIDGS